jgi:hypothetical protein
MTNLFTQQQVTDLSISVGWEPAKAKIGGAISMVEAATVVDGKVYADADKIGDQHLMDATWDASYSLYMVRALVAHRGTGLPRDRTRLSDPEFNARSALLILNAQGFDAWTVYQTGQYKAYLLDVFPPPPKTHVVVAGDTLSKIADKYGVTVTELLLWNSGIRDPNKIAIGQHIRYEGEPIVYVPPPFPAGLAPGKSTPSAQGLQRVLKAAGFLAGSVVLSDNYGPKTQAAVVAFHNQYTQFRGTAPDPAIGSKGWAFLWNMTKLAP